MKDAFEEKLSQVPFPDIAGAKEVVIVGNYGGGNLGDEAMLDVLIEQINQREGNIRVTVPSRRPDVVARLHSQQSVAPVSLVRGVFRALMCSILLIGGGTIFSTFSGPGVFAISVIAIIRKALLRKRVYFYGIGYSSSTSRSLRILAQLALKMSDHVYVRDTTSLSRLTQKMRLKSVTLIPELALFLRPDDILGELRDLLAKKAPISIGFSLMYIPFLDYNLLREAIREFTVYLRKKHDVDFWFLTFQPRIIDYDAEWRSDTEIAQAVLDGLPKEILDRCHVLPVLGHFTTLAVIREFSFVVSMRYHCLVFAHSQGKPYAAISFEDKHESFVKDYGGVIVPLSKISGQDLIQAWEKRTVET